MSGTATPARPGHEFVLHHIAPPAPRRPSIDSLTTLRGLGAMWVVFYHFSNDLFLLLPGTAILRPLISQGHFAVPIFFVLSGYVLTYNYLDMIGARPAWADLRKFWGRRLLRIYPLHLATLLMVLAMVLAARVLSLGITAAGYSARDFILNVFLVHTWVPHFKLNWNYPSWSISSEWFAYLFFPLACMALVRVRRLSVLLAGAFASQVLAVALLLAGKELPFRELTAVIGPFLLGCTFARMVELGYVPRGMNAAAWALTSVLVALPFLTRGSWMEAGLLTVGSALVYALGAGGDGGSRFWTWRPLIVLGDVSYSLYLMHTIVQKLLYELLPAGHFVDRSWPLRLLVVLIYAGSIAGATWLAYDWIDVGLRKTLRRRLGL